MPTQTSNAVKKVDTQINTMLQKRNKAAAELETAKRIVASYDEQIKELAQKNLGTVFGDQKSRKYENGKLTLRTTGKVNVPPVARTSDFLADLEHFGVDNDAVKVQLSKSGYDKLQQDQIGQGIISAYTLSYHEKTEIKVE